MARGRFISKMITYDVKVNNLSSPWSMLGFTWLLSHADANGRTMGDPAVVKSLVFPRQESVTVEQVEDMIREWADQKMILWYEVDNDKYIEFINFDKHQIGLRKDREQVDIPSPAVLLMDDQPPPQPEPKPMGSNAYTLYAAEIGDLTPMVSEVIGDLIDDYTEAWLIDAIGVAVASNVRKLSYIKGVLRSWKERGRDAKKPTGKLETHEDVMAEINNSKYKEWIES